MKFEVNFGTGMCI